LHRKCLLLDQGSFLDKLDIQLLNLDTHICNLVVGKFKLLLGVGTQCDLGFVELLHFFEFKGCLLILNFVAGVLVLAVKKTVSFSNNCLLVLAVENTMGFSNNCLPLQNMLSRLESVAHVILLMTQCGVCGLLG
jgi:hypothetical protein